MSAELIERFQQYRTTVGIERIRISEVPTALQPLVMAYRDALNRKLTDPENESWDSLGPDDRWNAVQAVMMEFGAEVEGPKGNCPRCSGIGYIRAYSHVRGGRCMQCDGTGNIKI